jgi:cytochrome b6-f complex iron-sulfur subunit
VSTPQRPITIVTAAPPEHSSEPSRRQFCAHACQAASLVAVSVLLPACGGGGDDDGNPTSPTTPTGQALPVVTGTVTGRMVSVPATGPLAAANGAALVTSSLGSFLAYRSSQTSATVLTAVCTHEGCTVDQFNGQLFTCPCHGSRYTTGGAVANGPATRALTSFPATVSADTLTFTA